MNAGDVLLLDIPTMESELLGLIWRGNKIDHPAGEHDDYANAVAGATYSVLNRMQATAADILSVTNPLLQEFNDFFRTGY